MSLYLSSPSVYIYCFTLFITLCCLLYYIYIKSDPSSYLFILWYFTWNKLSLHIDLGLKEMFILGIYWDTWLLLLCLPTKINGMAKNNNSWHSRRGILIRYKDTLIWQLIIIALLINKSWLVWSTNNFVQILKFWDNNNLSLILQNLASCF